MPNKKTISILLIQIFSIFLLTACGGGGKSNTDPSLNNASFNVLETATNGTKVGTALVATDPDTKDVLTYKITKGNTGTAFAINKASGQITVAKASAFNPLPASPYKLTVEVDDGAGGTGTATITITVDDVNLTGSIPKTLTVDTNSLNVGAPLGSADDGLTYSIVGGNTNGAFAIDPNTGQITIVDPSAIHPGDTFQLQIQATNGTLTDTVTIAITIPSTSILPAGLNNVTIPGIDKGDIKNGVVIATLGAFDGITYSIVGFNADSPFAIDSVTGEITVNNSAAISVGDNVLEILVSNGVVSEILTLTITVNDTSLLPDGHSLSGVNPTVTIGTPIGSADDGLTYGIVGGADAGSFTIDPETGLISINDGANLGSGSYTLEISVTTEGGFTETITVTVIIQSPPVISFTKTQDLLRRAAAGTIIGTITVDKKDATLESVAGTLTDSGVASSEFEIKDNKVVLTAAGEGNLTKDSYLVVASYTSDAGASKPLSITINIIDSFEGQTIKVIPFGNSLTAGEGYSEEDLNNKTRLVVATAVTEIPIGAAGNSYRYVIHNFQGDHDVKVDFIGSKNPNDWGTVDGDHEGWGGYNSRNIIDGDGDVYEEGPLKGQPVIPLADLRSSGRTKEADVVFITLGTNDALVQTIYGGSINTKLNLTKIIKQMREDNPNLVFLLANVAPIDSSNDAIFKFGKYDIYAFLTEAESDTYAYSNEAERLVQFNKLKIKLTTDLVFQAKIKAKVTKSQSEANKLIPGINDAIDNVAKTESTASSPVIVVDMKGIFTDTAGVKKELLSDGIHPNDAGEKLMAEEWVKVLDQFFAAE